MPQEVILAMCAPMHEIIPRGSASGAFHLSALSASLDAGLYRDFLIGHLVQALDVPWLFDPVTLGL
jgi:hypothetical protein